MGARPPFREGTKAILPYKIGHMALLDNPIAFSHPTFGSLWTRLQTLPLF